MRITVNGEFRELDAGATVDELLEALAIERGRIAVEVNREIVPRSLHPTHTLSEGDRVEVVTMVGGG